MHLSYQFFSNPIQDATDKTIACNDDGTSGALQLTATVAAGTPITAYWNQSKVEKGSIPLMRLKVHHSLAS